MKKKDALKSFVFAFHGFKYLWNERNFRLHCLMAILAFLAAFLFRVTKSELLTVFLCVGLVMFAEAINTAIEYLCDIIQPEKDLRIKKIKDISAAAVLITAIVAALIGLIVFIPYIIEIL